VGYWYVDSAKKSQTISELKDKISELENQVGLIQNNYTSLKSQYDSLKNNYTILGNLSIVNLGEVTITNDATWYLENSPYLLYSTLVIEENVTLTIEPGVTIKLYGPNYSAIYTPPPTGVTNINGTSIIVKGTLVANGTENKKITFTSASTSPEPFDWDAIEFKETSVNSIINYCIFEYGFRGICCWGSSPTISNNTIRNFEDNGIMCVDSNATIINNTIVNNCDGIQCTRANPFIFNNTILYNRRGVWCEYSSPSILRNNISHNDQGIHIVSSSTPVINNNIILNNTKCGIGVWYNNGLIVNAEYNWWGTTNDTEIGEMIIGDVDYNPWLNSMPF